MTTMFSERTSEVFDEVVEFHLPLRFDAGVVEVCVEHDDGEGQQEYCVRAVELLDLVRVTAAVSVREPLERQ